jgi:hypothetical protein
MSYLPDLLITQEQVQSTEMLKLCRIKHPGTVRYCHFLKWSLLQATTRQLPTRIRNSFHTGVSWAEEEQKQDIAILGWLGVLCA